MLAALKQSQGRLWLQLIKLASQRNENGACSYTKIEDVFTLGTELPGLTEGEQKHLILSNCHLKLPWELMERMLNLRVHPLSYHGVAVYVL